MTLDMLEGGHYDSSSGSTMAVGGHDPYGSSYSAHDSYDASKQHKAELPLWAIAWRISPAMLSILLSVGTSMLVFPFFTYMKSTGLLGVRLAQVGMGAASLHGPSFVPPVASLAWCNGCGAGEGLWAHVHLGGGHGVV